MTDLILSSLAAALLGSLDLLLVLLSSLVDFPPPLVIHLLKLAKVAAVEVQLQIMQVDDVRGDCIQEVPAARTHVAVDPIIACTC